MGTHKKPKLSKQQQEQLVINNMPAIRAHAQVDSDIHSKVESKITLMELLTILNRLTKSRAIIAVKEPGSCARYYKAQNQAPAQVEDPDDKQPSEDTNEQTDDTGLPIPSFTNSSITAVTNTSPDQQGEDIAKKTNPIPLPIPERRDREPGKKAEAQRQQGDCEDFARDKAQMLADIKKAMDGTHPDSATPAQKPKAPEHAPQTQQQAQVDKTNDIKTNDVKAQVVTEPIIKLTPQTSFTLTVGEQSFGPFMPRETWHGFTQYISDQSEMIVIEDTPSFLDKIWGFKADTEGKEIKILKASPDIALAVKAAYKGPAA